MTLLSLADYGARHSVSKQAAAKWKARGLLALQGDMIDAEASDARMRAAGKGRFKPGAGVNLEPSTVNLGPSTVNLGPSTVNQTVNRIGPVDGQVDASGDGAAGQGETAAQAAERLMAANGLWELAHAERVKANYLARLRQLEFDIKAGRVVEIAAAVEMVGRDYARVRTRLLAMPTKLAPQLSRLRTPAEIAHALELAMVEVLEELASGDLQAGPAAQPQELAH